ncbi:MAG: tetratricopeptide repeat protein [Bacteroidales bacterium]|nr:tetratricopeptide repeat protein [Bacteroidales bacterium]
MKKLAIIIGLFFLVIIVQAQLSQQVNTMNQANQAYSAADYEAAISQYESVVASGYESSALYFNLGNAYFKLNNIPAAILYYEKAKKLDPTDENIQFNLDLANSRIIDKMEPLPQFFLKSWWLSARNLFTSDQWAKTGVICFILLLISASLFIISSSVMTRKFSFWAGILFLFFMSVSIILSVSSYREYSRHTTAVIFTPTVTVKSSPNENSVDLFVIHEGTKVYITDLVEGWSEVRLSNGNMGWIMTEHYRPI